VLAPNAVPKNPEHPAWKTPKLTKPKTAKNRNPLSVPNGLNAADAEDAAVVVVIAIVRNPAPNAPKQLSAVPRLPAISNPTMKTTTSPKTRDRQVSTRKKNRYSAALATAARNQPKLDRLPVVTNEPAAAAAKDRNAANDRNAVNDRNAAHGRNAAKGRNEAKGLFVATGLLARSERNAANVMTETNGMTVMTANHVVNGPNVPIVPTAVIVNLAVGVPSVTKPAVPRSLPRWRRNTAMFQPGKKPLAASRFAHLLKITPDAPRIAIAAAMEAAVGVKVAGVKVAVGGAGMAIAADVDWPRSRAKKIPATDCV